jgi:flagellar basal-body rod modification protein FlgD
MSVVATVENGKIVESASQSSLSKTTSTSSDSMDKDAFLQLLVAQMKYQDPLEPTSNTEYISQYAQFSQVEQMQNMAQSMDLQRASALVGEEVYIKTTDSTGNTNYVQGKVDYVVYENSKAYLAIDESLYSIDDLDTVVDSEYLSAYNKATDFATAMNKLPNVKQVDLTSADKIDELESTYNGMTDYEKSFVASDYVTSLEKYVEKIKELRLAEEEANKAEEESSDETEETEDTTENIGIEGSEE